MEAVRKECRSRRQESAASRLALKIGQAPPGAEADLCAARAKRFVFYKQENAPQEKGECERKMAETILRMTGIQKYFPGVHALDNAQLEVREGEVMTTSPCASAMARYTPFWARTAPVNRRL